MGSPRSRAKNQFYFNITLYVHVTRLFTALVYYTHCFILIHLYKNKLPYFDLSFEQDKQTCALTKDIYKWYQIYDS